MKETIIDNSVTNYDECYLRSLELADRFLARPRQAKDDYVWLKDEIESAVEYYRRMVAKN